MSRLASPIALLVALPLLPACSAGSGDGLTSLSGAYTAGPADGGDDFGTDDGSEGSEESEGGGGEGPISAGSAEGTSGAADDGAGNPLCCQVGPQAGCDSAATEECVCTSEPSCCQNVWSQECVDLAAACGDPFCAEPPGDDDGSTGEPGAELACDPDFEFSPGDPAANVAFTAMFSDPVGLTWVGMRAEGPGGAAFDGEWGGVVGSGPFTWSHGFDGLPAGVWTFTFTHRQTENGADIIAGVCQKQI